MIGLIDYGVGNLFSLASSLRSVGAEAETVSTKEGLLRAERLILPGVGAFHDAADKLRETGLFEEILSEAASGKPLLGICLGMQLLFEKSYEYGEHAGLGLLSGAVRPIREVVPDGYKIPHIGWNALSIEKPECPLFRSLHGGEHVYFVHSFHATGCGDSLAATTEYGATLAAAVWRGNIFGCQFHPEKSGTVGLSILRAFCEAEA